MTLGRKCKSCGKYLFTENLFTDICKECEKREQMIPMGSKDVITAEGTFRYYDGVKKLFVKGKNFQKVFEGEEAKELFKKLVVVEIK